MTEPLFLGGAPTQITSSSVLTATVVRKALKAIGVTMTDNSGYQVNQHANFTVTLNGEWVASFDNEADAQAFIDLQQVVLDEQNKAE